MSCTSQSPAKAGAALHRGEMRSPKFHYGENHHRKSSCAFGARWRIRHVWLCWRGAGEAIASHIGMRTPKTKNRRHRPGVMSSCGGHLVELSSARPRLSSRARACIPALAGAIVHQASSTGMKAGVKMRALCWRSSPAYRSLCAQRRSIIGTLTAKTPSPASSPAR